ncbi:MAG: NAD-dependent epimerase/dehydratase family protein [Bacteroidota bacterium]
MQTVLITGAAGNLGGLLANYLKDTGTNLHLMIHHRDVAPELKTRANITVFKADLEHPDTLTSALQGVDTVVHFAGILFKHHPEKFLPKTNTVYFNNLLDKAIECKVMRIILISFPHVEGETFPEHPAQGKLDGNPTSMHAKTRLEEERLLFGSAASKIEVVALRVGMVYGKGILMIEGARWFAKHRLLGIWKKPTWIHLISTIDFLEATHQAILKPNISGIYHLGDDGMQTLQEFLDAATLQWKFKKPWRLRVWFIMLAAWKFEMISWLFQTRSPLTRDFVKIGMASYYGDTQRMKAELLAKLTYPTYQQGIGTL